MPGPEIFRGTRLEVDAGDVYIVACPWCDRLLRVLGPEVVDGPRLRQFHDLYHESAAAN